MTIHEITVLLGLLMDLTLGVLVFLTNTKRPANQQYFTLTLPIAAWQGAIWLVLRAGNPAAAELAIRIASATCIFVPPAFNMLRFAMKYPDQPWIEGVRHSKWFLGTAVALGFVCFSPVFLKDVIMPAPGSPAWEVVEPVYGWAFFPFILYYISAFCLLVFRFYKDSKVATGMQRLEIQFVFFGCIVTIITGVSLALIFPLFTDSSSTAPFAPTSVILLNIILAYGIATRRILDMPYVLRRLAAYSLLAVYLSGIYFLVWFVSDQILHDFVKDIFPLPHYLAAISIAFSVAPAHGWMQKFANQLFVNYQTLDVSDTL